MNPTPEEKQWLQEYLYETMTYRETYEEIYDHILSALQDKPEPHFFQSSVADVISHDFGDYDIVHSMEEHCKDRIEKQVKALYWRNLYQWVKIPLILFSAIIFLSLIYLYRHSILAAFLLFLFVFLGPAILVTVNRINFRQAKESIKAPVFRKVVYQFVRLYLFCVLVLFPIFASIRKMIFHSVSTPGSLIYKSCAYAIIATFMIVHALSLVKTYRFNFNTSFKPNKHNGKSS